MFVAKPKSNTIIFLAFQFLLNLAPTSSKAKVIKGNVSSAINKQSYKENSKLDQQHFRK